MRKLLLIKHARPEVIPTVPAHEWHLGEQGKELSRKLGQRLLPYNLKQVLSSEEPKAVETAQIVAAQLSIPSIAVPGLQEHDRSNVPQMEPRVFQSAVAQFFQKPARLVLGRETAEEVYERFEEAMRRLLTTYTDGDLAVVSHGTVIALYLYKQAKLNPYHIWRDLALPSYVVLSLDDFKVLETVAKI